MPKNIEDSPINAQAGPGADAHYAGTRGLRLYPLSTLTSAPLPFADGGVKAGFPSPAQDYMRDSIDLNEEIVRHRETTFYARVNGDSMEGLGIFDGDLVVVDRSLEARNGDIIIAFVDGEFTMKTYKADPAGDCAWLVPANPRYPRLRVARDSDFMVWGVVTHSIRSLRP